MAKHEKVKRARPTYQRGFIGKRRCISWSVNPDEPAITLLGGFAYFDGPEDAPFLAKFINALQDLHDSLLKGGKDV